MTVSQRISFMEFFITHSNSHYETSGDRIKPIAGCFYHSYTTQNQSYKISCIFLSTFSIDSVGSNLATTFPSLSTRNFVKFHFMSGLSA